MTLSSVFLLLHSPFLRLILVSIFVTVCLKLLLYSLNQDKWRYLFFPIFTLPALYYFGITTIVKMFIIFSLISVFNSRYIHNWLVSFFLTIQAYIIVGVILSPSTSVLILFTLGVIIFLSHRNITPIINSFHSFEGLLRSLNIVEIFILTLSFLIGSQPQVRYDAVFANLYNAKTYITTNSFSPLPENTSSIFPQNSILYYSFFYQLGQERGLQIAYILPLFVIFYCFKLLKIRGVLAAPLLLTPIIIFEASSGYYDLLMSSLMLLASSITLLSPLNFSHVIFSALLIGFASGSKYFPIFLITIPLLSLLTLPTKNRLLPKVLLITFLVILPLTFWLGRSYQNTGNPVFPFLQNVFPTPNIWAKNDILENNPMIKTPMDLKQWATGAFFYYPIVTFFKTSDYLEALPKYPTLIYILLIPIQLFAVSNVFIRLFNRKKLEQLDIVVVGLFFSYYFTGFITRYYRYLWPFQFSLSIFSLLYFQKLISAKPKILFVVYIMFLGILPLNLYYIFCHLQTSFSPSKLLQPDFYRISTVIDNPVSFLNQYTRNNSRTKILDASKYFNGRFNFSSRVFLCNWYWYDKVIEISKHRGDRSYGRQLLSQFDYIITHNPPAEANNYCLDFLLPELPNYQKLYQDTHYQIYATKP